MTEQEKIDEAGLDTVSDDTNLQCSVCVYQNYPCMGRFCELGVKLWLEWKADKMTKWKPEIGETYYIPCVLEFEPKCLDFVWNGFPWDRRRYAAGVICRTKDEAIELAQKMLAVAKERDCYV